MVLEPAAQSVKRKAAFQKEELKICEPQDWILIFKSFPIWLLSLSRDFSLSREFVNKIYLPQVIDWSDFHRRILNSPQAGPVLLYDGQVSLLGRSKFLFKNSKPLQSGIPEHFQAGRSLLPSGIPLIQLNHSKCGGAMTFKTL